MTDIVERAKKFQDHLRDTNSQEAEELVGELIAEVERLEYAVEAMQDTANKDKVRHREQIESLNTERSQLVFYRKKLRCLRDDLEKENADLTKELEESKKKVEELTGPANQWRNLVQLDKKGRTQ